jgi:chemotaxis family two-component system response regulator Rcp1
VHVLLIEDNPGDVRLVREAVRYCRLPVTLDTVSDGEQALAFVFKKKPFENAVSPDLIFLDLNLPKVDGRDVLTRIKQHPTLRRTPVLILSTSGAKSDVDAAYDRYANCYLQKPLDVDEFIRTVCDALHFWASRAAAPAAAGRSGR